MRITAFSTLAVGLGLVGSHLVACSDTADDCNATATCGTSGGTTSGSAGKPGAGDGNEGGSDGAGSSSGGSQGTSGTSGTTGEGGQGGGAGSPECTGDVADDPLCWTTNELGVFVSSDIGDDVAGDGTREAPYATITKGIASAAGKNVYVCLGAADAYAEKITLTAATDGVRLYGGFECDNWSHDVTRYVTVESPEPIALRIQSLNEGAHIENVRFFASDGTAADKSSFGAFVTDSSGVVLRRVEITAGDGFDGPDGDPGAKGANGSEAGSAPQGSDACAPAVQAGSWGAVLSSCQSQGGTGGAGKKSLANGTPGEPGLPTQQVTGDINNGGVGESMNVTMFDGRVGAQGDAGTVGTAAPASGSFTVSGFTVGDGKAGTDGFPGQGGGGGGATIGTASCFGASGGAGGMGGCGGTAGKGGQGGGASVGLFSWNSELTLESCTVSSGSGGGGGSGGKAGSGGAGADGGAGGAADVGAGIAKAGRGGVGGNGGNGGSGSGGTGGPSYAIAFSGTKPSYTIPDTTLTEGTGGDAGIGGKVADAKAPDGWPGDAAPEFEIQ